MKKFAHINATTVDEAVASMKNGKSVIIAGGTDLLGILKDNVLPSYPETLVNIKTIPNMDSVNEENGILKIGPLSKLHNIASNALINTNYTALALAAGAVGSPDIRNMGTIGGNICQQVRCWYFRSSGNYFNCRKKGENGTCYALTGDHRYHSIFGATLGCVAVNPSDTAPALVALNAKIITSKKRTIAAQDFFISEDGHSTALEFDEIVTEIQVPAPITSSKSSFVKFALRKSLDFPIVNCAAVVTQSGETVSAASIVLNAVASAPHRVTEAESYLKGKPITEESAQEAGEIAVSNATALTNNKYMIQIARTMVKRAILACK